MHSTSSNVRMLPVNMPQGSSGHTTSVVDRDVYIVGGSKSARSKLDGRASADVWRYSAVTEAWEVLHASGSLPIPMFGHATAVHGRKLVVFGGSHAEEADSTHSNSLHVFDIDTCRWTEIPQNGDRPEARWGHSMEVWGNTVVVYGGSDQSHTYGDLWLLQLDTMTFKRITFETHQAVPPPRRRHTACIWNDCMYVFGGRYSTAVHGDLWKLDLKSMQWSQMDVIDPRSLIEVSVDHLNPLRLPTAAVPGSKIKFMPTARTGHTAVVKDGFMFVTGGFLMPSDTKGNSWSVIHDEVMVVDLTAESPVWRSLECDEGSLTPVSRLRTFQSKHVLAVLSTDLVFACLDNISKTSQSPPQVPLGRIGRTMHSAVMLDGSLTLIGGRDRLGLLDDVIQIDLSQFTRTLKRNILATLAESQFRLTDSELAEIPTELQVEIYRYFGATQHEHDRSAKHSNAAATVQPVSPLINTTNIIEIESRPANA